MWMNFSLTVKFSKSTKGPGLPGNDLKFQDPEIHKTGVRQVSWEGFVSLCSTYEVQLLFLNGRHIIPD